MAISGKANLRKVLLSELSEVSSLEDFSGDGSVFQFLLEVYFPVRSHLPPYFA
jgi:hypothetical protein